MSWICVILQERLARFTSRTNKFEKEKDMKDLKSEIVNLMKDSLDEDYEDMERPDYDAMLYALRGIKDLLVSKESQLINPDDYTNHTGGAYGADTYGCLAGLYCGFKNHNHYRAYDNIKLSKKLRDKGLEAFVLDEFVIKQNRHRINKLLGKNYQDNIQGNLQARNYHQVSSSDSVFCFGRVTGDSSISGGTNTALQLTIILDVNVYVYDIVNFKWLHYNSDTGKLEDCGSPILTKDYAIVGTRDLEDYQVKDKETGAWVSREQYVGKNTENKVKRVMIKLFLDTLKQ